MSLVLNLSRSLRPVSLAVLTTLSLAVGVSDVSAQATTIQGLHDIGLTHAKSKPYNFTGRVFDVSNVAFGSGTLLRRHTIQTAGHVVFEPATGFLTYGSFTRALYENYSLSIQQIVAAQALSGYQAAAVTEETDTSTDAFLAASSFDMGLVLVADAPVDEDWDNYTSTPSLLSSAPTFVVGYPGVTFDGRTMAYVVPSTPWVPLGAASTAGGAVTKNGSALYEIDDATAEPGTSGGPIYVVPDGVHQYVEASVVGTTAVDPTAEFNNFIIRAIDKTAAKFIADAEYTTGLIKKVKISGPTTVSRGQTYTYTTQIKFATPSATGGKATTDRYSELKIRSSTPGTKTQPLVTVKKTSNTTFDVTFSSNNRSGTTSTLQVYYDKTATPLGKSAITIKIQ